MKTDRTGPPDPADRDDDDITLMLRARDDDRAAFSLLVERHAKKILNYFLRSGVQYDAEDLVQQTFIKLHAYRRNYKPSAKFTTFLFLIARQVWIDELRRRKRRENLEAGFAQHLQNVEADIEEAPRPDTLDIHSALAILDEKHRAVIELAIFQGLPYPEIATLLRIPCGTVKTRMFHAIRSLRKHLGHAP